MLRYDGPLLSTPNSTPSVYDMLSARGVTLTQGGMIDYYHSKVSSWLEAIIIHLSFSPVADDEAEDSGSGRGVILRLRFLGWGSDCEQRVEIRGDDDTVVAMDILPFKAVTQDKVRVIVSMYVCMYKCMCVKDKYMVYLYWLLCNIFSYQ